MDAQEISLWKETFFKNNFSVDHCLAQYTQKSDLETLRKDLKNYGTELQQQMSDILKNETEAIVNLAEYLTNLSSKIDNLSIPISQLREEIRNLFYLIRAAEESYNAMLKDIKSNNLKQNHIHLKLGIISSSVYINSVMETIENDLFKNLLTLERIVNKYSFQKIYLCELYLMTSDIEQIIRNVELKLVENINKCFLKAFKDGNKDILLRCLRMYVNLQQEETAHKTFQVYILRPEFLPLFTERYLEQCGYDLDKIYLKVQNILEDKVEILAIIVKEAADLNSFNFVIKSFWKEFDTQSRDGLPHITAPGNPELFQKRFQSTYNLLKYIAEKGGDKCLISKDTTFQNHLKRFNLPVYFEIKFQQIAGNFESDTYNLTLSTIYADRNDYSYKLKPSVFFWKALHVCFNENVYIDQLADNFIRLSMMLLSRYLKLLENFLKSVLKLDIPKEDIDDFIINALNDLKIVEAIVAPNYNICDVEKSIFAIVNKNMWPVLIKVFNGNGKIINELRTALQDHLITTKINECSTQLVNVAAIPRLYRRTNRNPPKEASGYVVEAVRPIIHFHSRFKKNLETELGEILNSIIVKVTNQYLTLVQEVLMSVCKTEESLRRLKSRTMNTNNDELSANQTDIMTDETKIREQIKFDVGYFYDKFYPLTLLPAKYALDSLRKEVYK